MASLLHSKAGCIHESWQNLPSQIAKETEAERVGDLPKPSALKPGSFSSALSRPYHINVYLFSLSFFFIGGQFALQCVGFCHTSM